MQYTINYIIYFAKLFQTDSTKKNISYKNHLLHLSLFIWKCTFSSFLTGVFCSIIGSAGGGSALISIPLLTLLGITPSQAIATAKVGALGTLLCWTIQLCAKAGKVDKKIGLVCALFGLV
jgi:uncharacterized membrane protein YfcA